MKTKNSYFLLFTLLLVSCGATSSVNSVPNISSNNCNHDLRYNQGKAPTCYENGYKDFFKCVICNGIFSDTEGKNQIDSPETIDKLSHDLKFVPEVKGTCAVASINEHYRCDICGNLFSDENGENQVSLSELTDSESMKCNPVHYPYKAPSEVVDDSKEYYHCETCGS